MNSHGTDAATEAGTVSSSLLQRVQAHDPQAWQRLTRIFGPVVYAWARTTGLQEADAADVMQETFRAVATRVVSFHRDRPGDSFRGWLWTITRNKIRDHFRALANRPQAVGGPDYAQLLNSIPESPLQEGPSQGTGSAGLLLARRVVEVVQAEFEPATWQAFWRVAVEGERPADVAAALESTIGAVYMAKSRVLKRLREELAALWESA